MKGPWHIEEVKRYRINEKDFFSIEDAAYELHREGFIETYNGQFAKLQDIPKNVSADEMFVFIISNAFEIQDRITRYNDEIKRCAV